MRTVITSSRDAERCSKCSPNQGAYAVVGASTSPDKLGYQVLHNVIQYGYAGGDLPASIPTAPEILGLKAYPSVLDCPDPVDLAVILVPNKVRAGVLEQCGSAA